MTVTMPVEDETASETSALLSTYKRAPMELVRGEGVELIDSDGKRYLDFASGIAVNALGYGDAGITGVINETLNSGLIHTSNLYRTPAGEELAGGNGSSVLSSSISSARWRRLDLRA